MFTKHVSETISNKYTTHQIRGMGIRKISEESEDVSKNNKTAA